MTFTSKGNKTLQDWFIAPQTELDELFLQAQSLAEKTFNRQISIFKPSPRFPSISITGTRCQLQCQHCVGRFLHQMHAITSPEELIQFCDQLAQQQGIGCLISGGCDDISGTTHPSTMKWVLSSTATLPASEMKNDGMSYGLSP